MKKTKVSRMAILALGIVVISGVAIHALGADSRTVQPSDDEVTIIMDYSDENSPQDANEVYLYPNGIGGYIEVHKETDPGASQESAAAEAATEVYLTPVKIDDTTYEYVDEDGVVLVTMYLTNEVPTAVPLTAARYAFDWNISPKSSKYGAVDLDVSNGLNRLYASATLLNGNITYIGYYVSATNTYYWANSPQTSAYTNVYLIIAASDPINFALKNDSNFSGRYLGEYWLTPD